MPDSITIRPAGDADSRFVAGLASTILEFGSPAWSETDVKELVRRFEPVLADAVRAQDERAAVLIAEDADGTPLGFISLKTKNDLTGSTRGHVADLAVVDGSRQIGVGRALMEAGEAWARAQGVRRVSLDVWSTNERALGFYRHLGYRVEALQMIKGLED